MPSGPPQRAPGTPTLDQLHVFLAVVNEGGFAAAARKLGRANSVVSYTVANLEAQLGVSLFDRQSTRSPVLTEAGRAMQVEACAVMRRMADLTATARGLLGGLEAEVSLVVDVLLPTARLTSALLAFQASFPTVQLRLHVEALGAVTQLVLDRVAVVGVSGPLSVVNPAIERRVLGHLQLIPVAAPGHPLAAPADGERPAARDHLQLVLTDRSPITLGQDFAVTGLRTWRLADLGAKHALLLAGIGWGNMAEPMVRADIAAGRLVALNLPDAPGGLYRLSAIWRADAPPGPAASWLIDRLGQAVD